MTASRRAASSRRSRASEPAAPPSIQKTAPVVAPVVAPLGPGGDDASSVFDGQYRIKLDAFEGPLDLLLHLIQQHELDILDIPVSFITEKYLEYLKLMQVLSIEIASEYLVMAATLVHLKSKMLLPVMPSGQEDGMPGEEEEDPRAELVRRLLEYQKYKAAAAELGERGTLGRDVFPRGVEDEAPAGAAPFASVEVFGLLEAFERILKRAKVKIDHEVVFDRISITDRIVELTDKLGGRRVVRFEWLFLSGSRDGPPTRFDLVITFLAMLEMCRMRLLRVYQTGPLAPIYMGLVDEEADELSDEDRTTADREADKKLAESPEQTEADAAAEAAALPNEEPVNDVVTGAEPSEERGDEAAEETMWSEEITDAGDVALPDREPSDTETLAERMDETVTEPFPAELPPEMEPESGRATMPTPEPQPEQETDPELGELDLERATIPAPPSDAVEGTVVEMPEPDHMAWPPDAVDPDVEVNAGADAEVNADAAGNVDAAVSVDADDDLDDAPTPSDGER